MRVVGLSRPVPWVPIGLLALCVVPVLGGVARLHEMGTGTLSGESSRFLDAPLPVVVHIISSSVFGLLGALQFGPRGCRSTSSHRKLGMVVVFCGWLSALTGIWMTLFYPKAGLDGPVVFWTRLLVGFAMILSIAAALLAIGRRRFTDHRAWMIRAYALGMGAGTQALTHLPWLLFPELHNEASRAVFMAAGWGINVAVGEWAIRRV